MAGGYGIYVFAPGENIGASVALAGREPGTCASSRGTLSQDLSDVIELRERVRTQLSTDQLAEARRMVLEWRLSNLGGPS